MHVGYWFENVL